MGKRFSDRHNYRSLEQEISVREDAPEDLRFAIPLIAEEVGMRPTPMRRTICRVLHVRPDPSNWSDYPNVSDEVNYLISDCPWFKVYDIAEALHAAFASHSPDAAETFEEKLNDFFFEKGIGWKMTNGDIVYRGSDVFTETTQQADQVLAKTGLSAAANEMQEALRDISRRPEPDVTGAIQHAMSALECTAREVTGKRKLTLGRIIPYLELSPPLDDAVDKLWGYASDRARHVREGHLVTTHEAELIVSIACSLWCARRTGNGYSVRVRSRERNSYHSRPKPWAVHREVGR